jgi:hypothetical protein
MKIKVAKAIEGKTVWCLNRWFAPRLTPSADVVGCPFKHGQKRLATPRELYKCRMFRIEKITSHQ